MNSGKELDWKYFRDEKPPFNQDIIFVPSPQFGLLFVEITRLRFTDHEGDHFRIGWKAFKEYSEEMWASITPPKK